jgi:DNA-binding response OmpR family regulator
MDVLVAEDEPLVRGLLAMSLQEAGFAVEAVGSAEAAFDFLITRQPQPV